MPPKKKVKEPTYEWKREGQKLKPDISSPVVRKRILTKAGITAVIVVLVFGIAYGFFWLKSFESIGAKEEVIREENYAKVLISGNYNLSETLILERLGELVKKPLEKISLPELQSELEKYAPVADIRISKDFPDQLNIRILERLPILALASLDPEGQEAFWVVDQNGVIFKPEDEEEFATLGLPFIDGVSLSLIENGRTKIEGVEGGYHLLQVLKHEVPEVYEDLKTLSFEEYDQGIAELGAAYILRGKKLKFVRFGVSNIEAQVLRLKGILKSSRISSLISSREIDLSIGEEVIIR